MLQTLFVDEAASLTSLQVSQAPLSGLRIVAGNVHGQVYLLQVIKRKKERKGGKKEKERKSGWSV